MSSTIVQTQPAAEPAPFLAIEPVPYETRFEILEKGEAETTEALIETIDKIGETTWDETHDVQRAAHAKGHAVMEGHLYILSGLPEIYAQGMFAQEKTLPIIMRISTAPGDVLDDNVSTIRGMAIKIIGVEGERLPGSERDMTQDFLMANGPAFLTSTAKQFSSNFKLLGMTTEKAEGAKVILSTVLQGIEKLIEKAGGSSPKIIGLGGQPETNVLGEKYYTQAPVLYGRYMAKLSIAPSSPALQARFKQPVPLHGNPNGLRDCVKDYFASEEEAVWELRVQLCTDIKKMPLEDAAVEWPEEESPYVTVARIVVPRQTGWNDEQSTEAEDRLSFSPWHGITAHRPLGSIMRVRKQAYEFAVSVRRARSGLDISEPRMDSMPQPMGCPFHQ